MAQEKGQTIELEPLARENAGEGSDAVYGIRSTEEKRRYLIQMMTIALVLFGIILVIPIAFNVAQLNWKGAAKLIVFYFAFAVSIVSLAIFFFKKKIYTYLQAFELMGEALEEEARYQLGMAGAKIHELNARMFDKKEHGTAEVLPDFLKSLAPFAMLIIKKETNIMQWGMIGAKLAKNAMDLWKAKNKEQA